MSRTFGPALPILPRYALGEFLRLFGACMLGFLLIYVLVDFFDRLAVYIKYHASLTTVLRYFLFKIPLIVTQLVPIATLGAVLLALGMMARHNEITALKACGLSTMQLARPLLLAAAGLSLGSLLWNEAVVPYSAARAHDIDQVEIRSKPRKVLLSEEGMWFHGRSGVYNVEHFDARTAALIGMVVYDLGPGFELRRIIEIPAAQWRDGQWFVSGAIERSFDSRGEILTRALAPGEFVLTDAPKDFQVMEKDAEELSFHKLRHHIQELSRKGIDTTEPLVDLHLKLALPLVPLIMVLIGVPVATRNPRRRTLATSVGMGLLIGFSYWVLLAFTVSLGHGGAMPPVLAAWSANGVFAVLGAFLFLGTE